jgi:multicomponent Na+:H+ antiporter subunit B
VIPALDLVLFVVLAVFAVLALRVRNLMAAVAVLAAFSLLVAVMFAGMAAVDVAFVEAVLGAGLTGILLVVLIRATGEHVHEIELESWGHRGAALAVIGAFAGLMFYASVDLPDRGDPLAPAHVHVSPVYLERSVPETGTPNVVIALLADFRSLDTLGELVVVFTAVLSVILVLGWRREDEPASPQPGSDQVAPEGEGSR